MSDTEDASTDSSFAAVTAAPSSCACVALVMSFHANEAPKPAEPPAPPTAPAVARIELSSRASSFTLPAVERTRCVPPLASVIAARVVLPIVLTDTEPAAAIVPVLAPSAADTDRISEPLTASITRSPADCTSESSIHASVRLPTSVTAADSPMPALPPSPTAPATASTSEVSRADSVTAPAWRTFAPVIHACVTRSMSLYEALPATPTLPAPDPLAVIERMVPSLFASIVNASRRVSVAPEIHAFESVSASFIVNEPAIPADLPLVVEIATDPAAASIVDVLLAATSSLPASATVIAPAMPASALLVTMFTDASPATAIPVLALLLPPAAPPPPPALLPPPPPPPDGAAGSCAVCVALPAKPPDEPAPPASGGAVVDGVSVAVVGVCSSVGAPLAIAPAIDTAPTSDFAFAATLRSLPAVTRPVATSVPGLSGSSPISATASLPRMFSATDRPIPTEPALTTPPAAVQLRSSDSASIVIAPPASSDARSSTHARVRLSSSVSASVPATPTSFALPPATPMLKNCCCASACTSMLPPAPTTASSAIQASARLVMSITVATPPMPFCPDAPRLISGGVFSMPPIEIRFESVNASTDTVWFALRNAASSLMRAPRPMTASESLSYSMYDTPADRPSRPLVATLLNTYDVVAICSAPPCSVLTTSAADVQLISHG
ncbi:MAG: hypothetical protein MUF30_10610 [Burkholderiales bacterium]|nr:hypothetical protein [Burkholderiales bacterium]